MYYYILDTTNVPQKDFERKQAELQNLLTEFNINGELARVTPLRIIQDLVDTAANRGATTLVACGTDQTFYQVLASLKNHDFTLAFIPFVENTQLGKIFGMTDMPTCVKTIAGRRIEKIDVAKIDDNYFIGYLELGIGTQTAKPLGFFSSMKLFSRNSQTIKLRVDDEYNVEAKMMGGLIVNTRGTQINLGNEIGNPQDGYLDLLLIDKLSGTQAARYKSEIQNGIYEKIPGATVVRGKRIEILEPHNLKVYINGREVTSGPTTIEVVPNSLKMIVGKKRTF
jgi:diacylglycerol kinase family enzyme